jgi:Tfp pilus assembly protein PilF
MIVLALACIVGIGVPLATTNAVRRSQTAVNAGNLPLALNDALSATRIQPGAASGQVQLALVLEAQGKKRQALTAAKKAVKNEPDNWSSWLILSRLDAETRHPGASLSAYRRARVLNPRSPVFVTPRGLPQ